jgi:tagatose-1,6-bisphosphate aldolase non-catalytic subunit AgaZ/GatZ
VDGRRTSSHGNKTSRSRSVVKQKGMVFGFRKTATVVVGPGIEEDIEDVLKFKCKTPVPKG